MNKLFLRTLANTYLKKLSKTEKCWYKRQYCTKFKAIKEFTVPQFCNISIKCPYSVKIRSLDVHKYRDLDKVILYVDSKNDTSKDSYLQYKIQDNLIQIEELSKNIEKDTVCIVEVPITANMDVSTTYGNINLENFNNNSILLNSSTGNIFIEKCQSEKIHLRTNNGNIESNGVLQAGQINIKTAQYGAIKLGRIQGLQLNVETEDGDIKTESSYCNDSKFITNSGHMCLKNIHKNCEIKIGGNGKLNLSGFDGCLKAHIYSDNADVQISRILADSKLVMEGNGTLILRLDENCQKNTHFKIDTAKLIMDENVKLLSESEQHLNPTNMLVQYKSGTINVKSFSWSEMFMLNFNKSHK